jgi:hypothetical protein
MQRLRIHQLQADGARDSSTFLRGDATWAVPPGGGIPDFHGCAALRTTTQNLPTSGAPAPVQFNAADEYDTDSIHDPSTNNTRLTIPTGLGGVWRFTATVAYAGNNTGDRLAQWIKNGTILSSYYGTQVSNAAAAGLRTAVTTTVELNLVAGDYIEVNAFQTSGGALNIDFARCTAHYLGAP